MLSNRDNQPESQAYQNKVPRNNFSDCCAIWRTLREQEGFWTGYNVMRAKALVYDIERIIGMEQVKAMDEDGPDPDNDVITRGVMMIQYIKNELHRTEEQYNSL